jgi:hypothetical protein
VKRILLWIFILAMYGQFLFTSYTDGRWRTFYMWLALVPFALLCWGISILLSGRETRDIYKHMTEEEREELGRVSASYGGIMGLLLAGPLAAACGVLYFFFGVRSLLPYLLLFCVLMVVAAPFMWRQHRKTREFIYATEYARQRGFGTKPANQVAHATSEPAPSADSSSRAG